MKNNLYSIFLSTLKKYHLRSIFDRHKIRIKFLLVGVWNTIFSFGIFVILYKLFKNIFELDYFAYTTAQVLGSILAIINAYICHKYFTFRSAVRGRKMILEFLRFSTTYVATFLLSLLLMPFFVEVLKINPIVSSIILNIIVILTSYIVHSRFSFKKSD